MENMTYSALTTEGVVGRLAAEAYVLIQIEMKLSVKTLPSSMWFMGTTQNYYEGLFVLDISRQFLEAPPLINCFQ
jgi:hypothetical protein